MLYTKDIHSSLGLDKYPLLKNMPNNILLDAYNINERYEFIGDTILDFITVNMIIRNVDVPQGDMDKIKSRVVKNETLSCLMKNEYQCSDIKDTNLCADRFESIIGAMYKWLSINQKLGINATRLIEEYLVKEWNWDDLVYRSILGSFDPCNDMYNDLYTFIYVDKDNITNFRSLSIDKQKALLHEIIGYLKSKLITQDTRNNLNIIDSTIDAQNRHFELEKIYDSIYKISGGIKL